MSWGLTQRPTEDSAHLHLAFEDVEFIALELPQGDGFTRDWWNDIYLPMVRLREERDRERQHRPGP